MSRSDRERRRVLHRPVSRFSRWLLVIVLLAGVVRIGYVAAAKKGPCQILQHGQVVGSYHSECMGQSADNPNDQLYYNSAANQFAQGRGFVSPYAPDQQWADHPPLASVVLASVSWLFDHEPLVHFADKTVLQNHVVLRTFAREQRYLMAMIGTFNVLLIGLLAKRIGGSSAGLLAAFLAAIYPNLWVNDGLLFAETIAITGVLSALLLALRCGRAPSIRNFAYLGVACACAALTRAELLLLAPLLVVPIAWSIRSIGYGRAVLRVAAAAITVVVVMLPWFLYNQSRFTSTVFISTNDGLALAGSYCDPMFFGASIGLWTAQQGCTYGGADAAKLIGKDESEVSKIYRKKALTYLLDHKRRFPLVVLARIGRASSLYKPIEMIDYNTGENRERFVAWPGLITYYMMLGPGIVGLGALLRCRERRAAWVLMVPAITVTLVVAATYGQTRFRATAEPSLVILSALGTLWMIDAIRRRRGDRATLAPAPVS